MIAGLDPAGLLELDGPMFDAVERAAGERWTMLDELAALQVELSSAHYLAYLSAHGVKTRRLTPLRIPRPSDGDKSELPKLGALAFAAEYGPQRTDGDG